MQVLQRARSETPLTDLALEGGSGRSLVVRSPLTLPTVRAFAARRHAGVLALADLAVLAGLLAWVPAPSLPLAALWALTVTGALTAGLYDLRLELAVLDEVPALLGRVLPAAGAVAVLAALTGTGLAWLPVALAATAGGHLAARALAYAVLRRLRRADPLRVLVVGPLDSCRPLATALAAGDARGLRLAGEGLLPPVDPAGLDALLVVPGADETAVADALRRPGAPQPAVFAVERLHELGGRRGPADRVGSVPVRRVRVSRPRSVRAPLKRTLDVAVSAPALLLLAPVLGLIALAVRRELGRGVLFRQTRVGLDGRVFELLKFRSLPHSPAEADVRWSVAGDSRIGPVGRFLRRWSLDELPQLVNVLRGDMTLVGPRPERPHFVGLFSAEHPHYAHRHRMPAGLTGLAQVSGQRGSGSSIAVRADLDNYYIENHTLWLDTKVLLRTVGHVLIGSGS